jgi:hypothetical protein
MHLKDEQKKKAIERQAHSVRRLIVDSRTQTNPKHFPESL